MYQRMRERIYVSGTVPGSGDSVMSKTHMIRAHETHGIYHLGDYNPAAIYWVAASMEEGEVGEPRGDPKSA